MTVEKSLFGHFPEKGELLNWHSKQKKQPVPEINGHIHTPHSFSAFSNVELAFQMAKTEGISVLGINDFYTTDGYNEFAEFAQQFKVFPLFNIEFMALQDDLQEAGIRVNDPNNPGRTYFCGKGLRYPVKMSEMSRKKVKALQQESNLQTYQMVEKLNAFFTENKVGLQFNAVQLQKELAKNLFRERHIAQAVRLAVFEKESTVDGRKQLFQKIFAGTELSSPMGDAALVENEIRGKLLKSGGVAFIPEDPKAFLSLEEVIELIVDAGGIPCYPVLLDDAKGTFTDYEADPEKLWEELVKHDVYSLELIPGRNDCKTLKKFVSFFHQKGFVITFGTEHNTPQLDPLKISCRGGVPLDEELMNINYEGVAVIAAHQYLLSKGMVGFLDGRKAKLAEKQDFIDLGKAVIAYFQKP